MPDKIIMTATIDDQRGPRMTCLIIDDGDSEYRLKVTDRDGDPLEEMRIAVTIAQFLRDTFGWIVGDVIHIDDHVDRPTFGVDEDVPMSKTERRRESWRRSSRKYRATQARERAQSTLFEESGE